jgi:hypothetical protein
MKKLILFIMIICLPLVIAESSDYEIEKVYVNGMNVEDNLVQVELGNKAQVEVFVKGTGNAKDVRVSAWIGGYQYGGIEEISEMFEVEDDVLYRKILILDIPEDLDVSNNEYTLHVEVYDDNDREEEEYTLFFEQEEHKIKVEDVILSSTSVGPGEYLGVKVRLANYGENDEEDIRVIASVPELGINNRVYLGELSYGEQEDVSTIYLTIPNNARGDYAVEIIVEYGNSKSYGVAYLNVLGEARFDENVFVSISNVKDLVVNEEKIFKVQITNLASVGKEFSLEVSGIEASVGGEIYVPSGETGEMSFVLEPSEAGMENVLVVVESNDGIYQEMFNVKVEEEKSYFGIVLSLVAVVIVVVGIVVFLKGMNK